MLGAVAKQRQERELIKEGNMFDEFLRESSNVQMSLRKLHFLFKERPPLVVILQRCLGLPLLILENCFPGCGLAEIGGVGRDTDVFHRLLFCFFRLPLNRLFSIILIS